MIRLLALFAALVLAAPAQAQSDPQNTLVLETTKGNVTIRLRGDIAPAHAERLKLLAREGFYNNVPFHRVIAGFMAQTGDGDKGNGTGRSKYPNVAAEFSKTPFRRGVVGMARASDPNSANSQFFIMRAPNTALDKRYTIFGRVVWGMDAVMRIAVGNPPPNPDRMLAVRLAADVPESERAPIYILRTDGPQFRELIEQTRRDRRADFSVCDVQIPTRVPRDGQRERSWWSIIPFIP